MRMARLNVYVPNDLAERARKAGLNVSAITQAAIAAELTQQNMSAWVAALPPAGGRVSHEAILAAIDAGRGDFGKSR
jgi:post-segregation antitoxin (ccd killing protein)